MAKMRVTDAGEPCKEGAPTVEVKADTFGREIRNQVNPEPTTGLQLDGLQPC